MQKKITLKLTGIRYDGSSIGNDIRVEVDVFSKTVVYDTKLKKGESARPNLELGLAAIDRKTLMIPATIRVIERDVLFPDTGQVVVRMKVDPAGAFPQAYTNIIAVRESREFLTKKTARFDITIEAHSQKRIPTVDDPRWTGDFRDDPVEIILARALYGEAGGESRVAKIAIGWCIRNRVQDSRKRWGTTYHDVILQPSQFEPFIDPRSKAYKKVARPPLGNPLEKKAWVECYEIGLFVLSKKVKDPTNGANHFYAVSKKKKPFWADEKKFRLQIGKTKFYRL